ncbi:DUF1905 domain-containing protein [Actinocrinis sp.]|uniref:DUF1905 domain-containing protein n=1 Tax=Actinocrinis sp. TaxID=1920516 RepID=UPI002D627CAC|nr:DUF1905 domain-containing protein [Actinocrinis sp.]HZP51368.1 DUF1905 domain-containing protein [Actinocrinis sp.]
MGGPVEFEFTGEIWHWRGPSPFHFVTVPEEQAADIQALAADVTYGWGMIPVRVRLGGTAWKTSLFPKDGGYVLPLKDSVRRAESVELGDMVEVELTVLGG